MNKITTHENKTGRKVRKRENAIELGGQGKPTGEMTLEPKPQ